MSRRFAQPRFAPSALGAASAFVNPPPGCLLGLSASQRSSLGSLYQLAYEQARAQLRAKWSRPATFSQN